MVEVMTKTIYSATVKKDSDTWVITTELPEIGLIRAEAEFDWQIDFHARANICGYLELDLFDFDMRYEFVGESPKYYVD
jgi:hypothetical protein